MTNEFFKLLDKYGNYPEPFGNWTTEDLIKLMDAIDAELQDRAPPDSDYTIPWAAQEPLHGNLAE